MKKICFYLVILCLPFISFSQQFSDYDVKYLKGVSYYNAGEYDFCIELMNDYINNNKGKIDKNYMPYVYRGTSYYYKKDIDKSLDDFLKDIEIDPERSTYSVAVLYAMKGNKEKALFWLEKNQKSNEAISKSIILNDTDWGTMHNDADFKALLSKNLCPKFKLYIDSTDYYYAEKNLKMALAMIEVAIKAEPDNIKGYHAKGTIFMQTEDFSTATAAFKKEIDLESAADYTKTKRYLGHQSYGVILSHQKDNEGAIKYLTQSVEGNKTLYGSLFDIAAHQMAINDFQGSLKSMKQYLLIDDNDDFAHYMTGLAYLNLGDTKMSKYHAEQAISIVKKSGAEVPQEYYDLKGN